VFLLISGHDTTSSTLSIVLAYLDAHPSVQARVRQEQQELVAQHGTAITPAVMGAMPYTEAVVREVWRLHPVVPVVCRKVAAELEGAALGPYKLEAGQSAWVGINHVLKTDPRWEGATGDMAPTAFNPDRFLTPEGRESGAQLVFGAGARACLGERLAWADIKVLLATLMRGYAFTLAAPPDIGGFPFPTAKLDCSSFRAL
jgi:cytochrome P450